MKVHSVVTFLSASVLLLATISPTVSAALRGNNDTEVGGIFDSTASDSMPGNNGMENWQGNDRVDKGYYDMVNDIFQSLQKGETWSISETEVKQLKQKFKQDKFKVNRKKKFFKDTALKVFKKNKNKKNVTEFELVMETLSNVMTVDPGLHTDLLANIEDGYAPPEDLDTVEPRAGEIEDVEEYYEDGKGRRLGVPTTKNRWANKIIRYSVVYEYDLSGYWMWALRVLPAMIELEEYTGLSFVAVKGIWTTSSAQADGTVYLRKQSNGCSAHIGAPPSGSIHYINIGPDCSHGNILHELLHTAGMNHQQVAQYRDSYITVNFQNIQAGMAGNFNKQYNHGFEFIYDYGSIMHYGEYGFSSNGGKTIDCRGHSCGQRGGLSFWDMWEIMYYYWGVYYVNGNL